MAMCHITEVSEESIMRSWLSMQLRVSTPALNPRRHQKSKTGLPATHKKDQRPPKYKIDLKQMYSLEPILSTLELISVKMKDPKFKNNINRNRSISNCIYKLVVSRQNHVKRHAFQYSEDKVTAHFVLDYCVLWCVQEQAANVLETQWRRIA